MRRGRRKDLYRTERDSLEGLHEKTEIQRKALIQEKNLAFSEDTCLEKEKVRSNVTPRKAGVGLKRRSELNEKRRLSWRLAWWGSTEKREIESRTCFTNHFFHFSGPPGFKLTCDAAKRNRRFGCNRYQKKKRGLQ